MQFVASLANFCHAFAKYTRLGSIYCELVLPTALRLSGVDAQPTTQHDTPICPSFCARSVPCVRVDMFLCGLHRVLSQLQDEITGCDAHVKMNVKPSSTGSPQHHRTGTTACIRSPTLNELYVSGIFHLASHLDARQRRPPLTTVLSVPNATPRR